MLTKGLDRQAHERHTKVLLGHEGLAWTARDDHAVGTLNESTRKTQTNLGKRDLTQEKNEGVTRKRKKISYENVGRTLAKIERIVE